MKTQTTIVQVREKVQLHPEPLQRVLQATKVHWELVDVVDFYGEDPAKTADSRARAHLGIL
jgi:hypothetical protein